MNARARYVQVRHQVMPFVDAPSPPSAETSDANPTKTDINNAIAAVPIITRLTILERIVSTPRTTTSHPVVRLLENPPHSPESE